MKKNDCEQSDIQNWIYCMLISLKKLIIDIGYYIHLRNLYIINENFIKYYIQK